MVCVNGVFYTSSHIICLFLCSWSNHSSTRLYPSMHQMMNNVNYIAQKEQKHWKGSWFKSVMTMRHSHLSSSKSWVQANNSCLEIHHADCSQMCKHKNGQAAAHFKLWTNHQTNHMRCSAQEKLSIVRKGISISGNLISKIKSSVASGLFPGPASIGAIA